MASDSLLSQILGIYNQANKIEKAIQNQCHKKAKGSNVPKKVPQMQTIVNSNKQAKLTVSNTLNTFSRVITVRGTDRVDR